MHFPIIISRLSFAAQLTSFVFLIGQVFAAENIPTASETVDLPPIKVIDSTLLPKPEAWRYAQIEGFEILSNGSDREAFRLVHDFQLFHQALVAVWPPAENPSQVPASLILCGRGGKFEAFKPKKDTGPESGLVSLGLRDQELSAIVIDLETKTLNLTSSESMAAASASVEATDDTVPAGASLNDLVVDHYRQLYREYIHFVLSRIEPRSPAWLEEGLSQLFMRMQFSSKEITVGKLEDPNERTVNGQIEDRDFNVALLNHRLLSFPEMFGVAHDSPEALNPVGSAWAKQCYAFIHYCIYGNKGSLQKPFFNLIARSTQAPINEAMFKECFGRSYSSVLTDLRGYIQYTSYAAVKFRAKRGQEMADPAKFTFRDATEAEIGRIKGEALRLAGNRDQARQTMLAAYARGGRESALLAALGLEELSAGETERARKFLEAAAAAKVVRPRAYLELARLRLAEATARAETSGGKLSSAQVAKVLGPLFAARDQRPVLPESYELISTVWTRSSVAPTRENLEVVMEGARRFPRRTGYIYQAAELMAQYGFNDDARALSDFGMKVASEEANRARFTALKASLPNTP